MRIWGIKGFSDCSENDTEGFWNPKTADAPTSRLEGLNSSPERKKDRKSTTGSSDAAQFEENCEHQADAPEDPFPHVVDLADLRINTWVLVLRRISRNVEDFSSAEASRINQEPAAPQT